MNDDSIAMLLIERVIGQRGYRSCYDTVSLMPGVEPVAEFGSPVDFINLMLPDNTCKRTFEHDPKSEAVVVPGLFE